MVRWWAIVVMIFMVGTGMAYAEDELVKVHWKAEIAAGLITPEQADTTVWKSVDLDHAWRRAGWCDAPISTYRLHFSTAPHSPNENDYGMLIHRAGNRLRVWINGHLAMQWGS